MYHRLPAAHHVRKITLQIDIVAAALERLAHAFRHARLHDHVGAGERQLDEPRCLERLLDVQSVIDDVGDDLDVRLRLIPSAHHAEADAHLIALHEGGDHRLQRALPRREGVGMRAVEGEQAAAALQHEAGAVWHDRGPEVREVALNERADVAARIDRAEIRRVAAVRRQLTRVDACLRVARIDERRALARVGLRQHRLDRHLREARIPDVPLHVGESQLLRLDHQVQRVGGAASVLAEREILEDVQHDERRNPLAVRRHLVHLPPAIIRGQRRDPLGLVLGEDILADGGNGFAGDDFVSDCRLQGDLEHLARDQLAHSLDENLAALVGDILVHDHRQRVDRVASDEHVELHHGRDAVAGQMVIE